MGFACWTTVETVKSNLAPQTPDPHLLLLHAGRQLRQVCVSAGAGIGGLAEHEHSKHSGSGSGLGSGTGTGSDTYGSSGTRGTGATGTGSGYDTERNQGAALTSGNVRSHIPGTQDNQERKAEQGYGQGAAGGGLLNSGSGRDSGYGSGTGNTGSGRDTGYGSGNSGSGNYGSGNPGSGSYGSGTGNTGGGGLVPSDEEAGLTALRNQGHTGTGTGTGTGHGHGHSSSTGHDSTGRGTHDSGTGGQQGGAAKLKAHVPGTKEYKAAHGKDTDTITGSGNHTGRDTATGMRPWNLSVCPV